MPDVWRLLRTFGAEPGFNMALDEALLLVGGPEPVLRFYTFEPAALSLGYFQRFADVPEALSAAAVVRRPTGGGAIHHENELTFSLALAAEHPLVRGDVRESYRRIHAALARGLAELGVAPHPRGAATLLSDRAQSGMCFQRSHPLDLAWNGRKGVGSAQRRTRERVLHHGSIKLGTSALDDTVAGLGPLVGGAAELADHLERSLARDLGIELVRDAPRAAELAHARDRAAHYTSEAFVRGR
jgi:lipoate-protein ligase A